MSEQLPRASDEQRPSGATARATARDRLLDALCCLVAAALGVLFLTHEVRAAPQTLPTSQVVIDLALGLLASTSLWWRRDAPVGVAVVCLLLGMFSASTTAAALLGLFSLAVHRPARPTLLVAALWIPTVVVFGLYSPTTDPLAVLLVTTPLALAATAWGMFVRARRQLLLSLRERALRAEADQQLHEDRARMAERTRIAREMHDVLAHRISLLALHAGGLEVRPDLPPAKVRETAELLRSTARQALEELRSVIGVLREEPGEALVAPQPSLSDIRRLVEQAREAGMEVELDMEVPDPETVPSSLGRDAYRIVQEALTNIGKHAEGSGARVRVVGTRGHGLHVSVRNRQEERPQPGPRLPGSGTGLLGLQERVALTGGTLVHGPDGSGDFVVDAELKW